jgi:RNA polymerase sigma-70 factor (ECF subfamily)
MDSPDPAKPSPSPMQQTMTIDWPTTLKTHEPWLRKVLRCRVGDAHAVDDLFQEIVVAVYRQLESAAGSPQLYDRSQVKNTLPENPDRVGPWLYRVAIRQSVNYHRKQSRKYQPKITNDLRVPSPDPEPLQWMMNQEACRSIKFCISQLENTEREILMLKFTENWTYQQLADRLGISARAVEHRLMKAKNKLRRLLIQTNTQQDTSREVKS